MGDNENIKNLIENFPKYIELFRHNNPFSGPSEYFYNKIVSITKTGNYDDVFTQNFIELIYATLASWGMHRMGPKDKGPKMNDFNTFKGCILQNKNKILKLKKFGIQNVDINAVMADVRELYRSFGPLMASNSKIVATTKVMHFLLPNLVLPMDREYTMKFFKKYPPTIKSNKDEKNIMKEVGIFEYIFREAHHISKKVDCSKYIDQYFSPTIPKVIDNAIISYQRESKINRSH